MTEKKTSAQTQINKASELQPEFDILVIEDDRYWYVTGKSQQS